MSSESSYGSSKSCGSVCNCYLISVDQDYASGDSDPMPSGNYDIIYHVEFNDTAFTPPQYDGAMWVLAFYGEEGDADFEALDTWGNGAIGQATVQEAIDTRQGTPNDSPSTPDNINVIFGPTTLGNPCNE